VKIVVDASQVAYVDLRQIKTAINRQLIEHLHLHSITAWKHVSHHSHAFHLLQISALFSSQYESSVL